MYWGKGGACLGAGAEKVNHWITKLFVSQVFPILSSIKLKEDLSKLTADSSKKINFYNISFCYFVVYNLGV